MPKTKVGKVPADHPQFRKDYEFTGVCECGFASFGWPTKKQAELRMQHHTSEHENAAQIRQHLDNGEIDKANELMMPPKEEVEAMTPKMFPVRDPRAVSAEDTNNLWDQVN
jgi:hypothetical protein